MALIKTFEDTLENLWHRRTAKLRCVIVPPGPGKQPKFNKKIRDKIVGELLEVASEVLVKRDAKQSFKEITQTRHLKKLVGWGLRQRAARLLKWAKENIRGPIIYAFWRGNRCLYVGRGTSWTRLKAYEKSAYLNSADSIEIFCIKTLGNLARAECLATHLYAPRDKKVKPAKVKWGKACPVCARHDFIQEELNYLCRIW
jgi:hypothetical protein